jgi:hypothetical protein
MHENIYIVSTGKYYWWLYLDPSSGITDVWRKRFFETGELLSTLYTELMNKYEGKAIQDLLLYASLAEKAQAYVWTYIDYGIRTPIYRTLQWLTLAFPNKNEWSEIIKSCKSRKEKGVIRAFINDLTVHMRKEYTLVWSMIMNTLHEELKSEGGKLREHIKSILSLDIEEWEIADVKGLESELKASYVLIDHGKSFLPFSIMQAPITPSYMGPGTASGDLYLFEENLVVDVKTGWLDGKTGLPTYCYGKDCGKGLSGDLKNISDMHKLYGIRKGIGVIAEDGDYIYLAIYVPWRIWRIQGPLLQLKSAKLPFIIYMNNIEYTGVQKGVKPHKAVIEGNKLRLTISAYDIREQVSSEEKEKGISSVDVTLEFPGDPGVQVKGVTSWSKRDDKKFTMEFEVEVDKVKKSIIEYGGRRIIMARLVVKRGETGERLIYPVLAVTE